jgi:hypothetical protein
MIIRSRPKYLDLNFFDNINIENIKIDESELFFSSGRAALMFFLKEYSKYKNKQLVVVTQAFNCVAVSESILQSNAKMHLVDIGLEDFSIRLATLRSIEKIDVLILTHYQGIINLEYESIAKYCKDNAILLIDDLAQTKNSTINSIEVGALSNVAINSFSFDKPITSFQGGSVVLNKGVEDKFRAILLQSYSKINIEKSSKALLELKLLKFKYKYSDIGQRCELIDSDLILLSFLSIGVNMKMICSISRKKSLFFIMRIYNKIYFKFIKSNKIHIKILNNHKVALIQHQRSSYKYNTKNVRKLEDYLMLNNIKINNFKGQEIHWNRYSILDKDRKISLLLNKFDIQFGNYNWSIHLGEKYLSANNVIKNSSFHNSDLASKYILNIPVWADFISNNTE